MIELMTSCTVIAPPQGISSLGVWTISYVTISDVIQWVPNGRKCYQYCEACNVVKGQLKFTQV